MDCSASASWGGGRKGGLCLGQGFASSILRDKPPVGFVLPDFCGLPRVSLTFRASL